MNKMLGMALSLLLLISELPLVGQNGEIYTIREPNTKQRNQKIKIALALISCSIVTGTFGYYLGTMRERLYGGTLLKRKFSPIILTPTDTQECFCQEKKQEPWVTTTCNHTFHRKCIITWINTQSAQYRTPDCPNCRNPLAHSENAS